MLTGLHLRNFVICDDSLIAFNKGFTAITGETGAGKSIMFDALALVTGSRANYKMIMADSDSAVITATFDISGIKEAKTWLEEKEIDASDELIIKRAIKTNKTSKCFINGEPVSVGMLSQIGEHLLRIYEQHSHHELMHSRNHLSLLDSLSPTPSLLAETQDAFEDLSRLNKRKEALVRELNAHQDRKELLTYHLNELRDLNPVQGEFDEMSKALKILSSSTEILQESHKASSILTDDEAGILSHVSTLKGILGSLSELDQRFSEPLELVNEAEINLQEASASIDSISSGVESNPMEEERVSGRIGQYVSLSRKHNVPASELHLKVISLESEALDCTQIEEELSSIDASISLALSRYWEAAGELELDRKATAIELTSKLSLLLPTLGLDKSVFECVFSNQSEPSQTGSLKLEFHFAANPGIKPDLLQKVVSGGELSRIALALQVIVAERTSCPTMIFDEVDVGISGHVSEIVGGLLRKIGENSQTIAVTHQASVAASAHQNLLVEKTVIEDFTTTKVKPLNSEEKTVEIARLLSGDTGSAALTHAKQVIERTAA